MWYLSIIKTIITHTYHYEFITKNIYFHTSQHAYLFKSDKSIHFIWHDLLF